MLVKGNDAAPEIVACVHRVNQRLAKDMLFSTQRRSDYNKILSQEELLAHRNIYGHHVLQHFMTANFFSTFAALGYVRRHLQRISKSSYQFLL